MIRIVIALILLAGFLAGLVVFMPLDTALRMAGADKRGLSWTSADGSLIGGRITGMKAGEEILGDGSVKLNPTTLLRLGIEYDFDWIGPVGRGQGKAAAFAGGAFELSDYIIEFDLKSLEGLALWARQSGGLARLSGQTIRFRDGRCDVARGRTWSDALSRNSDLLGAGWPDLTGEIFCDGTDLVLPFRGQSASGTDVDATARLALSGMGGLEARVSGFIPQDFRYALPIAGFTEDGVGYVYRFSNMPAEVAP